LQQFKNKYESRITVSRLKAIKIYDLEQPRFRGMPLARAHRPVGYTYVLHRQHKDTPLSGVTRSGASGMLVTSEHAGTHIDALCHQALNHMLNGGLEASPQVETPYGFTVHGIENMEPILAKGVMLDVAASKKVDALPQRYDITSEDLRRCYQVQGCSISEGAIVLVRTGYGRFWHQPEVYDNAPGVSLEATKWLSSKGARVVGADNVAWEIESDEPSPEMKVTLPCHVHLLVQKGIPIIENLNLEKLSSDKVYGFSFICSPLKLTGATGSPVRPLAITGLEVE
jgi:kynurenine formamidase